jgi:hypothetical protein
MDFHEDGQQRSEKPNGEWQSLTGLTTRRLAVRDTKSKKGVCAHHPKRLPL